MFVWNMACGVFARQSGGGPNINDEQYRRRKAVVKMFFVMGPTWLSEIISSALTQLSVKECLVKRYVLFFDVINALQVSVIMA